MKILDPLKAIRASCAGCCETFKEIAYCTADGVNAEWCPLWPYRFGCRPATAEKKYGKLAMTPGALPGPDIGLDSLPQNVKDWTP